MLPLTEHKIPYIRRKVNVFFNTNQKNGEVFLKKNAFFNLFSEKSYEKRKKTAILTKFFEVLQIVRQRSKILARVHFIILYTQALNIGGRRVRMLLAMSSQMVQVFLEKLTDTICGGIALCIDDSSIHRGRADVLVAQEA